MTAWRPLCYHLNAVIAGERCFSRLICRFLPAAFFAIARIDPAPARRIAVFMPKVLITDNVAAEGIDLLKNSLPVDVKRGLSPDELIATIPGYDALVVRSETKVTEPVIAAGSNLKVVARAGIGVDNIDLDAATRAGVAVVNAPIGNTVAAAEHTVAPDAGPGAQRAPGLRLHEGGAVAAFGLYGDRGTQQDPGHHRPGPGRFRGGPPGPPVSGCGWWPTIPSSPPTSPPA